jgi:DNA-binding transcriptional MerR regulator
MSGGSPRSEDKEKLYYSIREVSELLAVKPHVLRYWESQLRALRPKKSRAGNRMYRPKDVELLREIQNLLHIRRYTIAGARLELQRKRRLDDEPETGFGTEFDPDVVIDREEESGREGESEPPAVPQLARGESGAVPGRTQDEEMAPGDAGAREGGIPAPAVGEELELFPLHHHLTAQSGRWSDTGDGRPNPGITAAELAPLREELRRLRDWLEAGIVGGRNRG